MQKVAMLILSLGLCAGCTSAERLAEILNDREIKSCIWFNGNAGPYASVRTVSATGGIDIETCFKH